MPRLVRNLLAASALTVASLAFAQPPATPPAKPAAPPVAAPAAPPAATPTTAPVPPGPAAATSEYYPLKPGSKWVYRIDETRSVEMKCDKFENGEGTIITTSSGRIVAKDTIQVKPDGIYRTKINDLAITPPVKILALPAKKDASWDINSKVQDKAIVGKLTIKDDKEKLKLKNGTEYECVAVEGLDFKVDGSPTKVKTWFAPGKGIVKLEYETGQQVATFELFEYSEGK